MVRVRNDTFNDNYWYIVVWEDDQVVGRIVAFVDSLTGRVVYTEEVKGETRKKVEEKIKERVKEARMYMDDYMSRELLAAFIENSDKETYSKEELIDLINKQPALLEHFIPKRWKLLRKIEMGRM